jgi:hypothetical protein
LRVINLLKELARVDCWIWMWLVCGSLGEDLLVKVVVFLNVCVWRFVMIIVGFDFPTLPGILNFSDHHPLLICVRAIYNMMLSNNLSLKVLDYWKILTNI